MSKTLQIEVDPLLCANQERRIVGELEYGQLTRIQDDVEPSSGSIKADLTFSRIRKFVVLTGRISSNLVLQCAACLESMDFPVDIEIKLAVINNESFLSLIPDGYEPCLIEGDRLTISSVVEDELVLVLPDIARHAVCPVELPSSSASKDFVLETEEKKNPFEALKSLKKH
ncbi:MAG: YceD family protein [Cycloclasticus sp.]